MTDVAERRRIHFDPVIRLDNAISIFVLLLAGLGAWFSLAGQVDQHGKDISRVETSYKDADRRIEATIAEKVADERSFALQLQQQNNSNIVDIKATLSRIEDKLDRKADKPGWAPR